MSDASQAVADHASALLAALPVLSRLVEEGQIRFPATAGERDSGVTVSCRDMGNHLGIPGRILVDVALSVSVRTPLCDDTDAAAFDAYTDAVFRALASIADDTEIDGWTIRHVSDFSETPVSRDSRYRTREASATVLLQHTPPTTTTD